MASPQPIASPLPAASPSPVPPPACYNGVPTCQIVIEDAVCCNSSGIVTAQPSVAFTLLCSQGVTLPDASCFAAAGAPGFNYTVRPSFIPTGVCLVCSHLARSPLIFLSLQVISTSFSPFSDRNFGYDVVKSFRISYNGTAGTAYNGTVTLDLNSNM